MTTITITISNTEKLAMSYVAESPKEWIENAIHVRANIAIDEIVHLCVEKCLKENIQIPASKEAIVSLAFENQWVKTAEERNNESII
jgi:hypothetical protein